jgi:hypothetical protein
MVCNSGLPGGYPNMFFVAPHAEAVDQTLVVSR